ncbi:MAG: DUF748 domain-containing protein [Candidatus Omnitrophica bacterium]|nr:DUF748 domain-containing protein [Candidatus Omnitrophota bacterium]
MKKKFKIIIWVFAVLLVIFLIASILVGIYAPRIVEEQIQQNLKLKVSLGKVSLSPPFTITLERLEIGNFASIKKVSLSPNLVALLFGKIVIHGLNVVEPVINLEQSADGKLNLPVLEQKEKPPAIYLTSLRVQSGKIIFTDRKVTPEGFQIIVDNLNIKVAKVSLPITSLATNFNISAQLLNSQGKAFGDIVFDGWLDYLTKDMNAKLEIKDMDIANLSPYYGNFISNKKISSAMLNLSSVFNSKNNTLRINTDFNLSKLIYEQNQQLQPEFELMKDALDFFIDPEGNLHLEFGIDTKLDNPALSQEKLKSIILKAAMKNLANQPPQQLADKVVSVIDKYKNIGKELKSIFGE